MNKFRVFFHHHENEKLTEIVIKASYKPHNHNGSFCGSNKKVTVFAACRTLSLAGFSLAF